MHSALLFSELLDAHTLRDQQQHQSTADYIASRFQVGKRVTLVYNNGRFQSEDQSKPDGKSTHEKGQLCVVRFVKAIKGFGITV